MTKKLREKMDLLIEEGLCYFLAKWENSGLDEDEAIYDEMFIVSEEMKKRLGISD